MDFLLGAHVPTAGGLDRAIECGDAIGATAIQIFTRNQLQWRARGVSQKEATALRQALSGSRVGRVIAHGSYLVNLASPSLSLRRRSETAVLAELKRCAALGIPHAVFHPGAHIGSSEADGLITVAKSINHVLAHGEGLKVQLLLEVTAGQGSTLGHRFEQLAAVLAGVEQRKRVGICLDTCHLFAAGYDIASPRGYERTVTECDRILGLHRVEAIHLNDARNPLGSRVDRHAPVGAGFLGLPTFRRLLNDRRLRGIPLILETPGPLDVWRREIRLLRSLVR